MSLEAAIKDIVAGLHDGRFQNEQAISQGIVLRLLRELNWDTWDTKIVWPEFQTGDGGRADFALCHPPTKAAVIIEVKQPGRAEETESVRQVLEYAFHTGVPMAVLTDGQTWSFYLPSEKGSYEDRRVYKLDLFERAASEASAIFHSYLERDRVASENALETARQEYRKSSRRTTANEAIPEAWRHLVEHSNEVLVDLVANAVESKTGVRPEVDDVAQFLVQTLKMPQQTLLANSSSARRSRSAPTLNSKRDVVSPPSQNASSRLKASSRDATPPDDPGSRSLRGSIELFGERKEFGNFKEAMVYVLEILARRDSGFLERLAQHSNMHGRTRRYIAKKREQLYPERPDLFDASAKLPGGWYVGTNLNNVLKLSILKTACEVAGLKYGKDLVVQF